MRTGLGLDVPPGATEVSCSAEDSRGNRVSRSFEVTVVDTTAPVVEPMVMGQQDESGAYVGTADEILISGRVGDVTDRIVAARAEARERIGWIMDIYLLRKG